MAKVYCALFVSKNCGHVQAGTKLLTSVSPSATNSQSGGKYLTIVLNVGMRMQIHSS